MFHQPFINPASMTGLEKTSLALFHRNQWVGFNNSPVVNGINFNTVVHRKSRVGGTFVYDKLGVNKFYEASFDYSYALIETSFSSLALGGNFNMKMIQSNYSELETVVSNDPLYTGNTPLLIAPNGRFGIYYKHKQFYIGAALRNLMHNKVADVATSPTVNNQLDPSKMHLYLHGGYQFQMNQDISLSASFLGKYVTNSPMQGELTAMLGLKEKLFLGATYRTSNDVIALVKVPISKMFTLGYSYDMSISKLSKYLSGTHEVLFIISSKSEKNKPINPSIRF